MNRFFSESFQGEKESGSEVTLTLVLAENAIISLEMDRKVWITVCCIDVISVVDMLGKDMVNASLTVSGAVITKGLLSLW
jgi:hypothetical protein